MAQKRGTTENIPDDLRVVAAAIKATEAAADIISMAAQRGTPPPWAFQDAAQRLSEAMTDLDGDDLRSIVDAWPGTPLPFKWLGYESDKNTLVALSHFARDVFTIDVERHRTNDPVVWAMATMQAIRRRLDLEATSGCLTRDRLNHLYAWLLHERELYTSSVAKLDTTVESLSPVLRRVWAAWAFASKNDIRTDTEAYNWLSERDLLPRHGDDDGDDEKPPRMTKETFSRYLRRAREKLGKQKNRPRTGRRGRSIVSPE